MVVTMFGYQILISIDVTSERENERCCGNTSRRRVFPQFFRVLPNFHECFYNSIGRRRTCFLFLLENTATKKKKNNLFTSIVKM